MEKFIKNNTYYNKIYAIYFCQKLVEPIVLTNMHY